MIHLDNDIAIRLTIFLAVLTVMAAWERVSPRKRRVDVIFGRWVKNIGLAGLDTFFLRIFFPMMPASFAVLMETKGWGAFNYLKLPGVINWAACIVIFDFIIYLQHVAFHRIPALWRLHRVHHSDLDIDVTTGIRFHPLEIIISMAIKFAAVAALGFSGSAVFVFEILLNATTLFNHSNVWMSARLDRFLRLIVVTPDMHRVHHSIIISESGRNFGFNLPWWDKLCGTYQAQPSEGHDRMVIGLATIRNPLSFTRLLLLPFFSLESGSRRPE